MLLNYTMIQNEIVSLMLLLVRLHSVLSVRSSLLAKWLKERVAARVRVWAGARESTLFFFTPSFTKINVVDIFVFVSLVASCSCRCNKV